MSPDLKKQQGLGLPIAIFIIVIMSLIAVAVNQITAAGSKSYVQNVISTRAFYAAESGTQLKLNDVVVATPCACGTTNQTFTLTLPGLNGCQAVTVCNELTVGTDTYCTISSTGSCDGSNAIRQIEVRVK